MVSEKLQEHDSGELEFIFKDGGDGSGQQVVWNSTSMLNAKKKKKHVPVWDHTYEIS